MTEQRLFVQWSALFLMIGYGLYLAWDLGALSQLLGGDPSQISSLILLITLLMSAHAGRCAWQVAQWQTQHEQGRTDALPNNAQLKDFTDNGWFAVDVMIRLGLIGTVAGFILMLSTVEDLGEADLGSIQRLLVSMGTGMRVALHTTLAGLSAGLLLALQYQLIDHHIRRLSAQLAAQEAA